MGRKRQKRLRRLLDRQSCGSQYDPGGFMVTCELKGRHPRHEATLSPELVLEHGIKKIAWDGDVKRGTATLDVSQSPYL